VSEPERLHVTFVCTGNICRSPLAEWVLRHHLAAAGLGPDAVVVDSSGTGGWHEGSDADPRSTAEARRAGYAAGHVARRFRAAWFADYDLVVALDRGHHRDLLRLAPDEAARAKVRLLREFDPAAGADLDVPDPYYGGPEGFTLVREMVEAAVPGMIEHVREAGGLVPEGA
jgi:protein-tyrosine phosphatase